MKVDEIFGINNKVGKFKDKESYAKYIDSLNAAEIQEHLATEYGIKPPLANSRSERRGLINTCLREFSKRIQNTTVRNTVKKPSKSSAKRAEEIFKSFGV